ncbi:MAG: glutaminyl-peptide cyclotransferase [Deltaproteobacteria bacterium]|jgi:glutaminyl-peptide cyclotransferase|nr:glutaminyl-peptide cyclotransferase [Deltaproteobacteria bacterium]
MRWPISEPSTLVLFRPQISFVTFFLAQKSVKNLVIFGLVFLLTVFFGFLFNPTLLLARAEIIEVLVEKKVPRSEGQFTQGLVFVGDSLIESTGLYGQSKVCRYPAPKPDDLSLKPPTLCLTLKDNFFAEGIATVNSALYLLTWQEGAVFKLDLTTLEILETFFSPSQGWGLTTVGETLWRSDGTDKLTPHKIENFAVTGGKLSASDGLRPIDNLNELEYDQAAGLILANIYQSCRVAAIDPKSGLVTFFLDLSSICQMESQYQKNPQQNALNGLAFDESGRLWVTGKNWPNLYWITWTPPSAAASIVSAQSPVTAGPPSKSATPATSNSPDLPDSEKK